MALSKIKKGDEVVVIAGRDKGRRGTVIRVLPAADSVVVEGVNVVRKHVRGDPRSGKQGGILEQERPLPRSKVMLWNPATQKGDRVGIKTLENGSRVRFFKSNNEVVDR